MTLSKLVANTFRQMTIPASKIKVQPSEVNSLLYNTFRGLQLNQFGNIFIMMVWRPRSRLKRCILKTRTNRIRSVLLDPNSTKQPRSLLAIARLFGREIRPGWTARYRDWWRRNRTLLIMTSSSVPLHQRSTTISKKNLKCPKTKLNKNQAKLIMKNRGQSGKPTQKLIF